MWHRILFSFFLIAALFAKGFAAEVDTGELDCIIDPYLVINIGSGVSGVIDTVMVDRGDFVEKGQVIATLDSGVEKATMELRRAQSERDAIIALRKSRLEFAKRERERLLQLYEKGVIPDSEMDQAETEFAMAERELQEALEEKHIAELELKQAQELLRRRTIRSPISGVVVERFLSPGELVDDQPVLKMVQLDPLNVEVIAPVSFLGSVHVGQLAEVRPESPVNRAYRGKVKILDRMVDAASGTFGVRVELSNPDYSLPAGLKCGVRFLDNRPLAADPKAGHYVQFGAFKSHEDAGRLSRKLNKEGYSTVIHVQISGGKNLHLVLLEEEFDSRRAAYQEATQISKSSDIDTTVFTLHGHIRAEKFSLP
jgi:RND family efflux transporter MFP subunit